MCFHFMVWQLLWISASQTSILTLFLHSRVFCKIIQMFTVSSPDFLKVLFFGRWLRPIEILHFRYLFDLLFKIWVSIWLFNTSEIIMSSLTDTAWFYGLSYIGFQIYGLWAFSVLMKALLVFHVPVFLYLYLLTCFWGWWSGFLKWLNLHIFML